MNEIQAAAQGILQTVASGFTFSVVGAIAVSGVMSLLALLLVARSAR